MNHNIHFQQGEQIIPHIATRIRYNNAMLDQHYERSSEEQRAAQLSELGLSHNRENLQAASRMEASLQFPSGYELVLNNLNSPQRLTQAMQEHGIKKIIHAEGRTVWDHVRSVIVHVNEIEGIDTETRQDLRLLALYHDLGKTTVPTTAQNQELTAKRLTEGTLHQAMIGHETAEEEAIRAGLTANGVTDKRQDLLIKIIQNHMHTFIGDPNSDSKRLIQVINSLGDTVEEREYATRLLALLLRADGQSTRHLTLNEGQLIEGDHAKKSRFDYVTIWKRYEEGVKEQEAKAQKLEAEAQMKQRIMDVLGKPISAYVQERGIQPGPQMKGAIEKVQSAIMEHANLSPEEIRVHLQTISLS